MTNLPVASYLFFQILYMVLLCTGLDGKFLSKLYKTWFCNAAVAKKILDL